MRQVRRKSALARQRAQRRGRVAEWLCLWHLRLRGWHILARGWRCPAGEIDILARIARAAEAFLLQRSDLASLDLRFDLMLVAPLRLPRHWRGAWRADD